MATVMILSATRSFRTRRPAGRQWARRVQAIHTRPSLPAAVEEARASRGHGRRFRASRMCGMRTGPAAPDSAGRREWSAGQLHDGMATKTGELKLKTVVILIGNAEGRLSRAEWSKFVAAVSSEVKHRATEVFFYGAAPAFWRGAKVAWVLSATVPEAVLLREAVIKGRRRFHQDAAAWLGCDVELV